MGKACERRAERAARAAWAARRERFTDLSVGRSPRRRSSASNFVLCTRPPRACRGGLSKTSLSALTVPSVVRKFQGGRPLHRPVRNEKGLSQSGASEKVGSQPHGLVTRVVARVVQQRYAVGVK